MADRIHHTIRCINKHFTFKEWGKWCEEKHKKGFLTDYIVYEFNGYKFNDCDVCLNPSIITIYGEVVIKYAQCNDSKWCSGFNTISGGSPCSWSALFATKDEAIDDAFEDCKKNIESSVKWYEVVGKDYATNLREGRAALQAIEQKIAERKFKQLTLF